MKDRFLNKRKVKYRELLGWNPDVFTEIKTTDYCYWAAEVQTHWNLTLSSCNVCDVGISRWR